MHCERWLDGLYVIQLEAALGRCRPRQSVTDEDYYLFGFFFTTP